MKNKIDYKKREEDRWAKLFALGLKFNGEEFIYLDINFHWTELMTMTDKEFEIALNKTKERMNNLKPE